MEWKKADRQTDRQTDNRKGINEGRGKIMMK